MALGAKRGEVVRMILGRGVRVIALATIVGVAGSLAAAPLIRRQLYGITAQDPVTFIGVPAILAIVAMIACYVPARRAARVDPVVALRSD